MTAGTLIVKSNIKKVVKSLDKENKVPNVADEVGLALEKKVEFILKDAIERAKANQRRTLQARDLYVSSLRPSVVKVEGFVREKNRKEVNAEISSK